MTNNEQNDLKQQLHLRYLFQFFTRGIKQIIENPQYTKRLLIALFAYGIFQVFYTYIFIPTAPADLVLHKLNGVAFNIIAILVAIMSILYMGLPPHFFTVSRNLRRIGLRNTADETPVLVAQYCDPHNSKLQIMEFETYGLPLAVWDTNKESIESALNICIHSITSGKNNRRVLIRYIPADNSWAEPVDWHCILERDAQYGTLTLGRSIAGEVQIDLSRTPHILIGGSTGSGKTILVKLAVQQCIAFGMFVFIADLKGGVDFSALSLQNPKIPILTSETEILETLEGIISELNSRKEKLRLLSCANIDEYNSKSGNFLLRVVFVCDELAELFDKTGANKAQKSLLEQIESKITTIARQGRAFGIHLILATQRPDANVLPGQIKNNMDVRICGRADNVLSQIILDTTDAATMIPKDAQGRFLMNDGRIFQAYWYDESKVI